MAVKLGRRATLDRFLRSIARDRPRRARSDHDGAFIIALFQQSLSAVCPSPLGCWPPTAGHASVAGPPGNSSGCPAWRLRPVAQRSAGPASGAAYPAMRLQRRRSRDSSSRLADAACVRAHAGGLAAALRRRSGTGVLVCGAARVAGPGPCGAGAKDNDGATGENQSFHVHARLLFPPVARPDGAGGKRNRRHGCMVPGGSVSI